MTQILLPSFSLLLLACLATILIELGVLWLIGERRRRVLLSSVIINIATNIPLNILSTYLHGFVDVLWAELVVVVVEAVWYFFWVKDARQAACYSILCNAISFLLGLLFFLSLACFRNIDYSL